MDFNKAWKEYIDLHGDRAYIEDFMDDYGFAEHDSKIIETWRWGEVFFDVYIDASENYMGVTFRQSSGDDNLSPGDMNVEFFPVEAKTVTTVEYVRV